MDREVWQTTVHQITRVGQDLATKPPPPPICKNMIQFASWLRDKLTERTLPLDSSSFVYFPYSPAELAN